MDSLIRTQAHGKLPQQERNSAVFRLVPPFDRRRAEACCNYVRRDLIFLSFSGYLSNSLALSLQYCQLKATWDYHKINNNRKCWNLKWRLSAGEARECQCFPTCPLLNQMTNGHPAVVQSPFGYLSIHWVTQWFWQSYRLDKELSSGYRYPPFEQLGPEVLFGANCCERSEQRHYFRVFYIFRNITPSRPHFY